MHSCPARRAEQRPAAAAGEGEAPAGSEAERTGAVNGPGAAAPLTEVPLRAPAGRCPVRVVQTREQKTGASTDIQNNIEQHESEQQIQINCEKQKQAESQSDSEQEVLRSGQRWVVMSYIYSVTFT